jgi:cleavage stimulation factor subunit 3
LPTPSSFDGNVDFFNLLIEHCPNSSFSDLAGPVFRTDDLMNLFRNAVIPSTSSRPKSPPPRSGMHHDFAVGPFTLVSINISLGGGRPPPDYGPYQGPTSGRGRRY